jgi:predicted outer membrane repeat protein
MRIDNSTLNGNSAGSGGGIYTVSSVDVSNTILNAGAFGENIFNNGGVVTSYGYNLSSDDGGGYLTGAGDQINTDPLLGPLQNNGGPTFTHARAITAQPRNRCRRSQLHSAPFLRSARLSFRSRI